MSPGEIVRLGASELLGRALAFRVPVIGWGRRLENFCTPDILSAVSGFVFEEVFFFFVARRRV